MKMTVAITWKVMNTGASSVVSQAVKKPATIRTPGRCGGRRAIRVHSAPKIETARKSQDDCHGSSLAPGEPFIMILRVREETDMQRLTGLDAAFLALETPSAHMHVLGVAILDPSTLPPGAEPFHERVRSLFEARLHLVPPLRRRLVEVPFGLNVPSWIDDPDFDLDYHIRRAALPSPGTPQQLAAYAADVAGRPLDRDHPLWEMHVVEGLERGYIGFVAKLHHSLIDGVAGVEILAALFDLAPDAALEPLQAPDDWLPERVPGEAEMLGRAVADMVQHPAKVVRAVSRSRPGPRPRGARARARSRSTSPCRSPRRACR